MHFWEKVRKDLKSLECENFKNTQTFYYWSQNNWENQVLPRSELQSSGRPVWPASASRAELRCQTNNLFAKQLICSQRILATRHYYKRWEYMPAFFFRFEVAFFYHCLVGVSGLGCCTVCWCWWRSPGRGSLSLRVFVATATAVQHKTNLSVLCWCGCNSIEIFRNVKMDSV